MSECRKKLYFMYSNILVLTQDARNCSKNLGGVAWIIDLKKKKKTNRTISCKNRNQIDNFFFLNKYNCKKLTLKT